jgi:glycosyltransferase involved in cell wall biosynthesis
MKIVLFGTLSGTGGIQRILHLLAQILRDSGYQVLVISTGSSKAVKLNLLELRNIQIVFIKEKENLIRKNKDNLIYAKNYLKNSIEVVYDFCPDIYLGIGTSWNLSILPLVLPRHVRSVFYEVMSGVCSGWRDPRWAVKWWFDEVVCISPTVAANFARCFGYKKQITTIPGFSEPLELTASLKKPTFRPVNVGRARATFLGRLVPHKQAFWLVQQWELLKDVLGELHIHGTGPDEQVIRDYIASRGIGDCVKCFGSYPSEGQAYADLISSYDITLLPSIGDEGTPLVLMESMACGVPFVAYGVGGITDYSVDNPNVLIVPPEPNAFISGVKQMVHRLAQGQVNHAQLQQFYLERYSYEVLKRAWLSYLCAQ